MRVLVVQTAFLGDAVLTVPLLSLLAGHPRVSEVWVVASPPGAEFLEGQDVAHRVLTYDKRGTDTGVGGLRAAARCARSLRPDVALVPHRSFRSALLAALSGASRRIGFDASGGRVLLTDTLRYEADMHEVERVVSLARALGADPLAGGKRVPFRLRVPQGARAELARLLAERSQSLPGKYVLVAPGSRWKTKRWPPVRFAQAAGRIAAELAAGVVVAGADYESDVAAEVVGGLGPPERTARALDVSRGLAPRPLTALISGAALVLSNDSAAGHIAAGLGVPVVSVFGPTVPSQGFAPYSERARVVEADVACRPCGRHGAERCSSGTLECMTGVSVDDVVRAALELAGRSAAEVAS